MTNYLTPEMRKQTIRKHFANFGKSIADVYNEQAISYMQKAFALQLELHEQTYRPTGEHYLLHSISVARILAIEIQLDSTAVVSGLLHNYLHHPKVNLDTIIQQFGMEVASVVNGLAQFHKLSQWTPNKIYSYLEDLHTIYARHQHILLVDIANHLNCMRNLKNIPPRQQTLFIQRNQHVYIPLTYHLGLDYIKCELEDLCLRYMQPDIYYKVATQLRITKAKRDRQLQAFTKKLNTCLMRDGHNYFLKKRTKSIFSIWQKLCKGITFDNIYDLNAVRVITQVSPPHDVQSCFDIYDSIQANFNLKPGRYKDWISEPKLNGYQSLHMTAMQEETNKWVEIQIRTKSMNRFAEEGQAAHWRYKNTEDPIQKLSELGQWLKQIKLSLRSQ